MNPTVESIVVTSEAFCHQTDFLIEQKRQGNEVVIKVTTMLPRLEFDGKTVRSFAPPRYPWN